MNNLVSIIIPCYKQAHFLEESIESVLNQSYSHFEIIVIDDGSPDNTAEVAKRYPGVYYVYQKNQGLSAARNTGIRLSGGEYIVFLDADDRLLPDALQHGMNCCTAHPKCVFVSGHLRYITADGSILIEYPPETIDTDHYLALLKRNYIEMPATVMYRREVFDEVGGFDTALKSCEDYDLYLRIARRFPVCRHDHLVAEYRRHDANMSGNAGRMLATALTVLRSQRDYIQDKPHYMAACLAGVRFWRGYFLGRVTEQLRGDVAHHAWRRVMSDLALLARFCAPWAAALWAEADLLVASRRHKRSVQEKRA
jgi:glycosyltransferase involved in cell wall biosynthesis